MADFIQAKANEMFANIDFSTITDKELVEKIAQQLEGSYNEIAMARFMRMCLEAVAEGKAPFKEFSFEGYRALCDKTRHYYDRFRKNSSNHNFQILWIGSLFFTMMINWCNKENAIILKETLTWPGMDISHYQNYWSTSLIKDQLKKYQG